MAWGTPTAVGTNLATTTGAQTGNITAVTASVGDLVVVSGSVNRGGAATVSVSDSASNTWTTIQDFHSGSGTHGFLSWAVLTNALSSGTITVSISGGINWTSAAAGASKVTGAASSSTEDTAARATVNAAATTTPTITSGTPANSGDIFFTTYANVGSTADTYTEAGSWSTTQLKQGTTSSTFSQSYQVNAGAGTLTHQPTTTSRGYVQCIMAFKVSGGASSGDGSASGTGTALGVGASTNLQTASAAGVGAATATGAATNSQTAASSGVGTAQGIGAAINAQVASASGSGTAQAFSLVTIEGTGTASGSSSVSGISVNPDPFANLIIGPGWPLAERKERKWKPAYPKLREEIEESLHRIRGIIKEVAPETKTAERAVEVIEPYLDAPIDWDALLGQQAKLKKLERALIAYETFLQDEEDDEDLLLLAA